MAKVVVISVVYLIIFLTFGVSLLSLVGVVRGIRKKKKLLALVAGIVFLVTLYFDVMFMLMLVWHFDLWRGWELRFPVERSDYVVTLVQRPSSDFYESFLEIENAEHRTARVWIDADDMKWWNPHVIRQDGKLYVLRGIGIRGLGGIINADTPSIDPEQDLIYTRLEGARKMSELDFK